jgi:hypothetical protein
MTGEPKVLLCKLFERTSASGNRYMFGRLGNAKIIAFVDRDAEPQYGADVIWQVFLQAGDSDGARSAPRQQSTSSSAPPRQPRAARPKPDAPTGDGRPFSDEIPDLA